METIALESLVLQSGGFYFIHKVIRKPKGRLFFSTGAFDDGAKQDKRTGTHFEAGHSRHFKPLAER